MEESRSTEVPSRRAPTHDETPDARHEGRPQPGPRGAPMRDADEASRQGRPMGSGESGRPMDERTMAPGEPMGQRMGTDEQSRAAGPGQPMSPGRPGGAGMSQPHGGLVPPAEADMTVPPGEASVAQEASRPAAAPRSTDRVAPGADRPDRGGQPGKMFPPEEATRLRGEWQRVQAIFVDNPQEAVRGADALVTEVIQSLQNSMAERHKGLRRSTQDTEELRQSLHQYRALLDELLDA